MDLYWENEYSQGLQREASLLKLVSNADMKAWLGLCEHIDEDRVLLDEAVWKAFAAYRALLGRACLMTVGLRPFIGNQKPWYKDKRCVSLLKTAIGADGADRVLKASLGKLAETHRAFADGILVLIRRSP